MLVKKNVELIKKTFMISIRENGVKFKKQIKKVGNIIKYPEIIRNIYFFNEDIVQFINAFSLMFIYSLMGF
jgi:hypothetical protein